jgi:mitochondrial-processing peptidase subunit alpha
MYNATAYNHAYGDTGLFCIHASAPPSHVHQMAEVLVKELVNMAGPIGRTELERAKTQLQSMLLMNLEARPVIFEDIGRQVLATGERKRPEYFMEKICKSFRNAYSWSISYCFLCSAAKVGETDIARVARRLLRSQPAIAARGELSKLPSLADFQSGLLDEAGKMPSKLGRSLLFR